ncbi:response regulator transcription factor [Hathewaya limosa]|uniref:Stage 0 sporulation protein A homolog n=1 Tax=Hathewaya limosa TaxID=1536 RepID=A0ABU0JY61_HATLI|nr:response regulator transcription factor [Hathewaya limosa]AWZ49770.1 DNA-binding response regulator [Clostridiaceae bacterium 14S0207]MDQ0481029.1 DNA-binding response OmpR family regulator [Hathewaya limosa]
MGKILAIDDEHNILILIRNALKKDGHEVIGVSNPKEINFNEIKKYDLILLDVMMPEIDGFTLCEEIREITDAPIIFLTAKTLEEDVLQGLSIGGDDYLLKPFNINELRARIGAHLRREKREKKNAMLVSGVFINLSSKEIFVEDRKIDFTKTEYGVCEFLAKNRGQVFTKEQIYVAIFGYDGESDSATIAVHIKNIRMKFEKVNMAPIETIWGIGYKWE